MTSATTSVVDNELKFLLTVGECKSTQRQGWVENKVPSPESVSAHMHRMSMLCMMVPDDTLNKNRMIQMAMCHDIGESIAGDVTPAMKVPKEVKADKERKALRDMTGLIPHCSGSLMLELWEEYEAQETRESHFVRDMDLLEMIIQAYRYECLGSSLPTFFPCVSKLKHPWARAIGERILALREQAVETRVHPLPKDLATCPLPPRDE